LNPSLNPSPNLAPNLPPVVAPPTTAAPLPNINKPAAALKSVGSQPPKGSQEIVRIPEFNKTLMFNEDDLRKYNLIYDAYQQRLQSHQLVDNSLGDRVGEILGQVTAAEAPPAPTSIYLNSILFRSPGSAAAWINGRKYEVGVQENGVKLENITPYYAEVQLEASAFADINFDEWQEHFPILPGASAGSVSDAGIKNLPLSQQGIKIEPTSKTIHFTLKPNQRLDIKQKGIREGKDFSNPVQTVIDKIASPAAAPPASPPSKPASPSSKPGEPLTPAGAIDSPSLNSPNSMNSATPEKTAEFKMSADGHFYIPATLNQQVVNFKMDTGATITAISSQDAKRIGVDISKLDYKYDVKIANGTLMKAAETNIANFDIDEIKLKDVNILVSKGDIAQPLLGMSMLSKLKKFSIEGNTLTLSQ